MNARSEPVARAFGQVLRAVRQQVGLTQETVAEAAEIDRTTPYLYEHGMRCPTLAVILRLAKALQVDPVTLVELTLSELSGNLVGKQPTQARLRRHE